MYNQKSAKTDKNQSLALWPGRIFKTIVFLIPFLVQAQYPSAVEAVLKKSGTNRPELEKALAYSDKTGDPYKIKAMQFLIANMDIHSSSDYYWEDSANNKIAYNELDYADFEQSRNAFATVKQQNPGLKAKPVVYKDIETIKGDYLINNLEKAFTSWHTSPLKTTSFEDFCEYILPYRVSVEPVQNWRPAYTGKFKWVSNQITEKGLNSALQYVKDDYDSWFVNNWKEKRTEPLPRLGSLQLLFRKQGACSDIASMSVFTMRSQGIPAAVNIIPFWATATEGHYTNTFFDENKQMLNCDYGTKDFRQNLVREPAKVIRLTYSKNPETLASFEDMGNIPKGFLQQQNYIDVTNDFWETTDVKCPLYVDANPSKIVYATTFNGLAWRPFWWGKTANNETVFTKLCRRTVIIPQYYSNGKMIPAGAPVVIGNTTTKVLQPDLTQTKEVTIAEKEKYLKFKLGITYQLLYWDNKWIMLGKQTVNSPITEMKFERAPKNALFLFVASDSRGLERPFIIEDNGERFWF
ncbi:transglutaminase domain-containing protein [Flavobacterium ajazii]|uniref:transglutaminase domain-containing protein n=1 Tax=Flavobacterium ajazii TaxID=2692318 RepID=UPI0013D59EA3|nr:transglutaminase domain-containing protein [Flavobacterium ajazii]